MRRITPAFTATVLCCFGGHFGFASPPQSSQPGQGQLPAVPLNVFDPRWTPGDTWDVRFDYAVDVVVSDLSASGSASVERTYTYTVQPGSMDNRFPDITVAKVLVEPELDDGDWLLTFDCDRAALLQIEQVILGGENSRYQNPFVLPPLRAQSWMQRLDDFGGAIIHDFPRLLGASGPATTIVPAVTGTEPFSQDLRITHPQGNPRLRVIFTRDDPLSGLEHKTQMFWDKGSKWWSLATIEHDGEVVITGTLLP